jgi:hypothetical protein
VGQLSGQPVKLGPAGHGSGGPMWIWSLAGPEEWEARGSVIPVGQEYSSSM